MRQFLPYGQHAIDDDDIAAVIAALRSSHITQGPRIAQFEHALAEFVDAEHVSVCASGSAALLLAYSALGIGPGDEIITSPITFAATATAAHWLGASVVFADVESDTGNLRASSVRALITANTRAIVAVHLAGLPADMTELRAIADAHNLLLIEDAAHALGATVDGTPVGASSDAVTFSFHPVKHLTTGEGGAVVVRDAEHKRRIDQLRHHGIERDSERFNDPSPGPWYYEVQNLGFNYRLTDIQCALGLSQLAKQPRWLSRRRHLADQYCYALERQLGRIAQPQGLRRGRQSAHHLFPVLIDFAALGLTRAALMDALKQRGIGTQVHYIPLTRQPYFQRKSPRPEGAGTLHYYERTLSLPMYPGLRDEDVDYVVDTLAQQLSRYAEAA